MASSGEFIEGWLVDTDSDKSFTSVCFVCLIWFVTNRLLFGLAWFGLVGLVYN